MLILPALLFEIPLTLHSQISTKDTLKSRAQTKNPHGEIAIACEACHSTAGWSELRTTMDFDHNKDTYFALEGQHQNGSCKFCHTDLIFANKKNKCYQCHQDVHKGQLGIQCETCHNSVNWKPVDLISKHALTRFPLLGKHAITECSNCHKNQNKSEYAGVTTECSGCHIKDYQSAKNPNHLLNNFSTTCQDCHTSQNWYSSKITDHARFGFPLTAGHAKVNCKSCHSNHNYSSVSGECVSCHQKDFNAAVNPNHITKQFSTSCVICHTTNPGWAPASFDHSGTGFSMTGGHAAVQSQCQTCHHSNYNTTSSECYSCHQTDYTGTTNPNHVSGNFPTNCSQCHTTNPGWKPALFDHSTTAFPLTGAHLTIQAQCQSCHTTGYTNTPTDCYACHQSDFQNTTNPNHITGNYSTRCNVCHSTNPGWTPAVYDHNNTAFPLTGAHLTIQYNCQSCHVNGYNNTSSECYSCHQSDYTGAANPNHVTGNIPTTCNTCHTTNPGWRPVSFDHNTTAFPLTGAHLTIQNQCQSCHASGYANTPTNCYSCHQADYTGATNPNHVTGNFSTTCATCHTTNPGWRPASFDHSGTAFPLTGAHLSIQNQCQSCHAAGYTNTPTNCYACHQADYTGATNPNHVTGNFSTTCTTCHTTNPGWRPASFDHSGTAFPLTGAHLTIQNQCQSCHAAGYTNTPTNCYACHQTDYTGSVSPSHSGLQFPFSCEACHTTSAWQPSTFNHGIYTGYTLQGAHQTISAQCSRCHTGNLTSAPTLCYSCHAADYNGATNPNHASANFPHECQTCHNQTSWSPSTFNHDAQYFPIYSGTHRNRWTGCGGGTGNGAGCHTNNSNYAVFSCIHCHEHNQTSMNSHHSGVSGYSYNSQACFNCHPDGNNRKMRYRNFKSD